MSDNTLLQAIQFAFFKHNGQVRKGTDLPYFKHVLDVSSRLEKWGAMESVVVAGVLHDTLEDTETSFEELNEKFGPFVAMLVKQVTNPINHKELSGYPLMLKSADVISNVNDTFDDYKILGPDVVDKFTNGVDKLRYYLEILEKMQEQNKSIYNPVCEADIKEAINKVSQVILSCS